jgi:predicted GNAT family N-acyltransferase
MLPKSDTYAQFIRRYRMDRFTLPENRRLFNEALALRIQVLVQNEGFPLDLEPDAYDNTATHWTVRHAETYHVLAVARMILLEVPKPKSELLESFVLIDRLVVSAEHRNEGMGRFLLVDVLSHVREELYLNRIGVVATVKTATFFENMGFSPNKRLGTFLPLPDGTIVMEKTSYS